MLQFLSLNELTELYKEKALEMEEILRKNRKEDLIDKDGKVNEELVLCLKSLKDIECFMKDIVYREQYEQIEACFVNNEYPFLEESKKEFDKIIKIVDRWV